MKKILFLMLLCLPFIAMAQTDPKYLAGAITLDDGKVSFKTEIQAPSLTKDQLYETMLKWLLLLVFFQRNPLNLSLQYHH